HRVAMVSSFRARPSHEYGIPGTRAGRLRDHAAGLAADRHPRMADRIPVVWRDRITLVLGVVRLVPRLARGASRSKPSGAGMDSCRHYAHAITCRDRLGRVVAKFQHAVHLRNVFRLWVWTLLLHHLAADLLTERPRLFGGGRWLAFIDALA